MTSIYIIKSWFFRAGVAVVGATSRPDLLDAALLRPGRLDRLLLCGLPGPDDRAAILAALARPLRLAPDVDLPAVAAAADRFTGAASAVLPPRSWNLKGDGGLRPLCGCLFCRGCVVCQSACCQAPCRVVSNTELC